MESGIITEEHMKPFDEIPYLENERLILKQITHDDADRLDRLRHEQTVYRYVPALLFERKYEDVHELIERLYDTAFKEKDSLFLGIYLKEEMRLCGIAELYAYKPQLLRISLGYRLLEEYWGRGIATETVKLLVDYLEQQTDIRFITASVMRENKASARVLQKNGFRMLDGEVQEDWGHSEQVTVTKWIR